MILKRQLPATAESIHATNSSTTSVTRTGAGTVGQENLISGGTFNGPVFMGRDFSSIALGADGRTSSDVPGQPIHLLRDAIAFEVHPAIDIPRETDGMDLPLYVARSHDSELYAAVEQAAAGSSTAATLVGGSACGKTRACWEAVHQLPDGWRLWHPIQPTRPRALLDGIGSVQPRTVVWLNEAQHYLLTPGSDTGERVASGLRELLRDPDRAPVLILGTLWPEYWSTLTTPPGTGDPADPHAQARALITGTGIAVAGAFEGNDLDALTAAANADQRLQKALRNAQHGEITQYLAGVPALLERYRAASPGAKAVIHAAMDARRLGHAEGLPLPFLEEAAIGYLTDQQFDNVSENWLEESLSYLAAPTRGARGVLTRIRFRPGQTEPDPLRYRLADYLEQTGQDERRSLCPPQGFWNAALDHLVATDDLLALGEAAQNRWRLRVASALYTKAASVGQIQGLVAAAQLLDRMGEKGTAQQLLQQAAAAGHTGAMVRLAEGRIGAADHEEAERLYSAAAEAGNAAALVALSHIREAAGQFEEAERLAVQASQRGEHKALLGLARDRGRNPAFPVTEEERLVCLAGGKEVARLALRHLRAGDLAEAERLAAEAARLGSPGVLSRVAGVHRSVGNIKTAERLYRQAIESGAAGRADDGPYEELAKIREEAGDLEEAEHLYRVGAEKSVTSLLPFLREGIPSGVRTRIVENLRLSAEGTALLNMALMRERIGDGPAAERLHRLAGDRALAQLIMARDDAGDTDEAERLAVQSAAKGSPAPLRGLAKRRGKSGDTAAEKRLYQLAADAGDTRSQRELGRLLHDSGDNEGAKKALQFAVNAGDREARHILAHLYETTGDMHLAEDLARQAANEGDARLLARLARTRGRNDPRWQQLLRYGIEPDGTASAPWTS
ncbi:tetratricopeptide repeat protein [Streptomyces chartreusis]|uniref:tetratricopeptide repeat protein n=1 Tax=Streptomyces chartreusis TaxID=1969 RepID=UPI0037A50B41